MGLIKAAINAVSGNLADQYKEYIYCESLSNDILAAKGHKRVGSRGTNKGDATVITDGSAIGAGGLAALVGDVGVGVWEGVPDPVPCCGQQYRA